MYKFLTILLFAYGLALTTEDIYDNSWALIIGINKYENVQKLDFAADDALAMKEILIESFNFPEDNITMLLNQEATKNNIVKEFSNIAFKAQERDRVLVFFAGHGETMELPEGGQMGYLIPVNGDAENLYYSSIRMEELKSLALMSKAKHMLYLIDACYGGIAAVGSRGLSTNTPNYIDKIVSDKARQIITAGGKGEQVIEKSEWGHSAFTLNLKRGLKNKRADLNSDGYITANELGMFLSEKVTIDSENQQTPQYGRMTSQEGEFVFILSENTIGNQQTSNNDQTPNSNNNDEAMKLILDKIAKLEKETSENNQDNKNSFLSDFLFHTMFYSSNNINNTSMRGTNRFVMGLSKSINTNIDLQVGIMFDSYDGFESIYEYQSMGLRLGVNKKIYQNIISTQVAIHLMHSVYENDDTDTTLDSGIGSTLEISLGVINPYYNAMSLQFITGYNLNRIKNQDDEYLLNSPFIGIGMQVLGDWF